MTTPRATTPTHLGVQVTTPAHLGVRVTTPTHLGVQVTTPAHLGVQVTTPTHLGVRFTTPTHPGVQVTTPTHLGARFTTPTHPGVRVPRGTTPVHLTSMATCSRGPSHAPKSEAQPLPNGVWPHPRLFVCCSSLRAVSFYAWLLPCPLMWLAASTQHGVRLALSPLMGCPQCGTNVCAPDSLIPLAPFLRWAVGAYLKRQGCSAAYLRGWGCLRGGWQGLAHAFETASRLPPSQSWASCQGMRQPSYWPLTLDHSCRLRVRTHATLARAHAHTRFTKDKPPVKECDR